MYKAYSLLQKFNSIHTSIQYVQFKASEYPKLIYKHVYLSTECEKTSHWDRTRAGHRNKPSTVEVL